MQNTHNSDQLVSALFDLVSFLNSPKRDDILLREAGVRIDRALFPLLVRTGMKGTVGVSELAEQVGRDHSTVSRQVAKLEELGLVERDDGQADRRRRSVRLRPEGEAIVRDIASARRKLLARVLQDWSEEDCLALARLNRRFADALIRLAREAEEQHVQLNGWPR